MTDDRLSRWLETAEKALAPDPTFAAELRDELRLELGLVAGPAARPAWRRRGRERTRRTRGRTQILLVAALIVTGAIGFTAIAGRLLERPVQRLPDVLTEIRESGRIRIAVTSEHPQFSAPGQPAAGFDVDFARALATQLGVRGDVVFLDATTILTRVDDSWDLALPSVPVWEIDATRFEVSSPYYRWPHLLVVNETSEAAGPADLTGAPICAVSGDPGEDWLRGAYGRTAAPITTQIVTRSSDEDCLAALAAGDVAGVVTSALSDADIQVRAGIKAIRGPDPEPRAVIVWRAPAQTTLLDAIDTALNALHQNGTLTQLSQNRFGGADLTAPGP